MCPTCHSTVSHQEHRLLADRFTCANCGTRWESVGTGLTIAAAISAFVIGMYRSANIGPNGDDSRQA